MDHVGIKRVHCAVKSYCNFQNTKKKKQSNYLKKKKHKLNAAILAPGHSGSGSNSYIPSGSNNNKNRM